MVGQGLFCWVGENIIRLRRLQRLAEGVDRPALWFTAHWGILSRCQSIAERHCRPVYPHTGCSHPRIGRASNTGRTRIALWSLLSSPVDEIVVGRRRTWLADRDCVKRSLLSVCLSAGDRRTTAEVALTSSTQRWVSFLAHRCVVSRKCDKLERLLFIVNC